MTLTEIRRLDECLASCLDTPADAVAKIDLSLLREWLEYADSQVWKPRRLRQIARAARKRIERAG